MAPFACTSARPGETLRRAAVAARHMASYDCQMTDAGLAKTIEILGISKKLAQVRNLFEAPDDRSKWTQLIRSGIPSKALENTATRLQVSISELSRSLGLPARTMHRRLEKGELLSPEETERSVRAARALAKAQQVLGDENGRAWLLEACRGLTGEIPITLLDTADGFTAVIDELGRLEYGVIS
jgi:putative toxin-antitoxin system antitoxin component (TIGR02293 family)